MKTVIVETLKNLTTQIDTLVNCSMNEALVINQNFPKSVIITHGVASCVVVIIYHPNMNFTIFGHLNETSNFAEIHHRFLEILKENKISLSEVEITLAGGWSSYDLSVKMCQWIKTFWAEKNVKSINSELLFLRDGLTLPAEEFSIFYNHRLKNYPSDQLMDYIHNTVNKRGGDLYNIFKQSHFIDDDVKKIIVDYCKKKSLIDTNDTTCLVSATRLKRSNGEHIVSVLLNDPMRCLFSLIGFDSANKKLFVSHENCFSLTHLETHPESIANQVVISNHIGTAVACAQLLQGMGSPLHQASDHHHKLMAEIHTITNKNKFFDPLIQCLNKKTYEKALRLLCNNINKNEFSFKLIQILLNYQDSLKIDINQQAGENQYGPLHYAALNAHQSLYDLLISHNANPSLTDKDGKSAQDFLTRVSIKLND